MPKGPGSLLLYMSSGLLYVSHFIPVPLTVTYESFVSRRWRFSVYTYWPRKYRILGTRSRSNKGGGVAGLLLGEVAGDDGLRAEYGVCNLTELEKYRLVVLMSDERESELRGA
jgi:hypothetical protein